MAIIANDKTLVKQFVRINFINATSSFPNWEVAEERYLVPIIGQDVYDNLEDIIAAAGDATALDQELLEKCRAVVAPLAYLIELPAIHAQLTDAGLRVISTENMPAAHKWEFNKVEDWLVDAGAFAIEALLKFLFKNKDSYADWTGSDQYAELDQLLFKTGDEFNKYFRVAHPHRVFWELRPLIKEVQDFYIISSIGEEFFTELKDAAAPTDEQKKAIELLKKTIAQTTIVTAVEKMAVKITERGFTVLLSAGNSDAVNSGDAQAPAYGLSMLHDSCRRSGDAYLLQLQEYLNKKASAEVFPTYFDSDYYEAPPEEEPESKNANRKIFGL